MGIILEERIHDIRWFQAAVYDNDHLGNVLVRFNVQESLVAKYRPVFLAESTP